MDPTMIDEPALSAMEELVTLNLKNVPFSVNKTKLSNESLYFNRLFIGNFQDSNKKEFNIDIDVSLGTFKTFVDWLEDDDLVDDIWGHYYNRVISKYVHRCYNELLELFRLASFYAVDNLLESLTYIIVLKWLQRDNLIKLWLMAEELNQENLMKVAFSTCLDLFDQFPLDQLVTLPRENFLMLINNSNLRASERHREKIISKWNELHEDPADKILARNSCDNQSSTEPSKTRILCCVTGFRTNNVNGLEEANVFAWDGDRLEELAKLIDGYKIYTFAGTQIIGRGFSIYVVGGEKFLGHGTFNFYITRYCLITKKWYKVERLLEGRRHMVATFVGNKLVLIGGVGKYRVKLTSVHILDIHTGVWTKGKDAPFTFTDIPAFCVIGSRVLVAVNGISSYDVRKNDWSVVIPCSSNLIMKNIMFHDEKLYAFIQTQIDAPLKVKVCVIERISEVSNNFTFITQGEVVVGPCYHVINIDNHFVWFMNNDGTISVRIGKLIDEKYKNLLSYLDQRHSKVNFRTNVGCFRILNPDALFMQKDDSYF